MFRHPFFVPAVRSLSWVSRPRTIQMPLRATIQHMAFSSQHSNAPYLREQPGDEPDDVLFNAHYGARTIELNRPKKLNSLNGSMARKIIPRLKEWEKSQLASVVIIAGAGEKAFCAGGDVAALAKYNQEGKEGQEKSADYFGLEYKLDHLIATYRKPYVAYMDGITMGGGVGLSVHAPLRIATERTIFAMPETTIGFFPDVGGSFFLPRLDGFTGTYLALTSERLQGANVFYSGIATHYIHSSALGDLTSRLSEMVFKDYSTLDEQLLLVDATIEEFVSGLPHDEPILLAGELRKAIDRCFKYDTIEEIMDALQREITKNGETAQWAQKTLDTISQRSPTSVKTTLRLLRVGKRWDISETFQREHEVAKKFMAHPDFSEGVIARLVEKRTPQWNPSKLSDVSAKDIDNMLLTEGTALELLTDGKYKQYPYQHFALPTEQDIKDRIEELHAKNKGKVSQAQIMKTFQDERNRKQGLVGKISEVIKRKCVKDEAKGIVWETTEAESGSVL